MTKEIRDIISIEVLEDLCPMFSDDQISYYFTKNGQNIEKTCYELLILKSQNSNLRLQGYDSPDTSKFFLRLASKFRKFNSGVPQ